MIDFREIIKNTVFIVVFSVAMVSCQNSTVTNNTKSDSINVSKKEEFIKDSTNKKMIQNDSLAKLGFNMPKGYVLYESIVGDLNGDSLEDQVFIIKGTEKEKVVINRFDEKVDRNRRGVMIYLTDNDTTFLALENLSCFYSENEDGGVYFAPELSVTIENGKLYFHYGHGRYGGWKYTFRYQESDFKLIGYDALHRSEVDSDYVAFDEESINFLTKKKQFLKVIEVNADGKEKYKETWKNITINSLIKLSEIKDFEELDMHVY